jgi:hypothetical protein
MRPARLLKATCSGCVTDGPLIVHHGPLPVMWSIAFTELVEIHAWNVPGKFAAYASVLHFASAPAMPPRLPL